jgi:ABC-2 type transport system permease protein
VASVRQLLWPRTQGLYNRFRKASRTEQATALVFIVFGLTFWLSLSVLFGSIIFQFHGIEVVGPIVLRKLMELMMVSLFALLCFSNVVTALSTYYLSDDLELLLSMPIGRVQLYVSRLIETISQSSWMALAFGLPLLVSYGIAYEADGLYYLLATAVLGMLVLIPASIGVATATLLVTIFPARRIQEALIAAGVICLVAILLTLRLLRPERLADADSFESVAAYVAELQAPMPDLLPPKWASEVLLASLQGRPLPFIELGLLATGAVATFGLARWLTTWLHDSGRSKAQEARAARLAKAGWLDWLLALWTAPLSSQARAIVIKDVKTFFRDPGQWTQLFLVASIVAIAIVSVASLPLDVFRGPWMAAWVNTLAFLMLALVGLVMAALAARFQFSAVSAEGRAFWLVRTGPLTAEAFLWAKAWPYLPPMIITGEVLAIASGRILGADTFLLWIAGGTALLLGFGISGLAVGMGAIWPDFKADNLAQVPSSPAGLLFMASAVSLVLLVLTLEAPAVYFFLAEIYSDEPFDQRRMLIAIGCMTAAAAVCIFSAIWPVRYGARRLWERELPNS